MKEFIKDVIERAVKTFCQVMLGFIGVDGIALGDINWGKAVSIAGAAALASVLTSIASYNIGNKGTASIVKE